METSQAVIKAAMVRTMTTTAHVLAVDDDPSVRQMIADYLTDNDVRVTTLASGRDIGEVMERETIDLVILDLRLPGEDGMQIAVASLYSFRADTSQNFINSAHTDIVAV